MSWYRQIRVIYTICSNTFFYILWATVLNGLLDGKIDYKLFLLSLFTAFSMVLILEKTKNIKLAAAISFICSELFLFLISGLTYFFINSIYICFILIISKINEDQDINYELYKYRAKQVIAVLVVIGFMFSFTKLTAEQSILKFYIIFLISASILMREARNYYYKIKNNKSFSTNVALTVGIIFISLDKVFNIILICLKYFVSILSKIADEFIKFLAIVLEKPLNIIVDFLKNKFLQHLDKINKVQDTQEKLQNNKEPVINTANNIVWPSWFTGTLKVIVLLLFLYLAYRIFSKYKRSRASEHEAILEERVRLSKEKSHNGNLIKKAVRSMLRLSDLKEQVINIYKKFELKTNEKGIFRSHMTARQLENVTKAYIEKPEGINDLTNIYNEVKFSNHKVTKEQAEIIKQSFIKVKKQL